MTPAALNLDLLAAAVRSIPPDGLSDVRNNAATFFSRMNFPTQKHEDWKYTNLASTATLSNDWLATSDIELRQKIPAKTQHKEISELKNSVDAHWLVIRNGIVDSSSCEILSGAVGNDVEISLLSEGGASSAIHFEDPLSAFNAALLHDGLHIRATANSRLNKPIGLIFADDGGPAVSQSRLIVDCEINATIKIVEIAVSTGDSQLANHVSQVSLAEGAHLDYLRIQQRDVAHLGINRLTATLNANATLNHYAFDFGNALTRNDIVANIAGADADASLHGLYLADRDQHMDNHLSVIHGVGPARSMQNYRGILNGRSRGVFNGKAKVMQGADGTDANQSNHNLLMSDEAEIDTKPELEIYADDVKCSHGATVGQLDESVLFYLQTRGLSRNDAKQVLTRAFATEILSNLPVEEFREYLTVSLDRRLTGLIENEFSNSDVQ